MIHDHTLLEKIAEIEHEQWIEWAKSIIESESLSPERRTRWESYMVPYSELEESVKDHDRKWAKKVLQVINNA